MNGTRRADVLAVCVAVGIAGICLLTAWLGRAGSGRALTVDRVPAVVAVDRLGEALSDERRMVKDVGDGLGVFENAAFVFRVKLDADGPLPLFVKARGTSARGVWPFVAVRVDGRFVSGGYVESLGWSVYRFELPAMRGWHEVELSFVNDRLSFPEDRNLFLQSVSFGGPAPSGAVVPVAAGTLKHQIRRVSVVK